MSACGWVPCERCAAATSTTSWTARADGSDCGNAQVCQGGACGAGCFIDDVARASGQFLSLIKGNLMMRQMFGCTECPESYAEEIESTARAGVEMFLRAYQPR